MDKVKKFDQNMYDSFKIFLITNFNIEFHKSNDLKISESINIKTKDSVIKCDYTIDQTLEINSPSVNDSYKKIIDYLKEKHEIISELNLNLNDDINNFVFNMLNFFEHIMKCDECKDKTQKILHHMNKTKL